MPNVLFRRLHHSISSVFWLVPALVIQMDGFSDRAVILVATATGVAWQLVRRRDLADRLAVLAAFWMVIGVGAALAPGSGSRLELGPTGATVGIVMGLVATEQAIRFVEGRRLLRQQATRTRTEGTVPAGP